MKKKHVLFCALMLIAGATFDVQTASGKEPGKRLPKAGRPGADGAVTLSPTGREVVGRVVISEGQQGKADEVTVQTDLATYRIKPTPILNNLLNLEGEMRFRFLLERVGEGDDESWQIVRYLEMPASNATKAVDVDPGSGRLGDEETSVASGSSGGVSEEEPAKPGSPAQKNGKKRPSGKR